MTRRLPKSSHHNVRAKRADPASRLAAASWQLDRSWALQHWWACGLTQGPQEPNPLLWLSSLLMLQTSLGAWTTLDKLSSSGPGWSCKDQETRSPGAGDQGQLLVGSGDLRATGSKVAHTGGSCNWTPHVHRQEAASLTRHFFRYKSYQGTGVYSESLKLNEMLFLLGRKY